MKLGALLFECPRIWTKKGASLNASQTNKLILDQRCPTFFHNGANYKFKYIQWAKNYMYMQCGYCGYSNSGARGKDFQKLMFSKKKSFDLVFHFFLPKSR